MNKPSGKQLLETLLKLLADQEGVKIEYLIEERNTNENQK